MRNHSSNAACSLAAAFVLWAAQGHAQAGGLDPARVERVRAKVVRELEKLTVDEEATFDVTVPDGGLELGPRAWPEAPVVAGMRLNPRAAEDEATQRQCFELSRLTSEQLARAPGLLDVFSQVLPTAARLPSENHARLLLALDSRLKPTARAREPADERRRRAFAVGMWLESDRDVDATLEALQVMKAKAMRAALGKARSAYATYAKTEDDTAAEQKTAAAFASTLQTLVAIEPKFRTDLEQWLRSEVRAKRLGLPPPVVPPQGVLLQHHSRLSELRPTADGLVFFSWETVFRRSLERLDEKGQRQLIATNLDAAHGLAPWKAGWAWVDHDGVLQQLVPGEATPKVLLSFARFSIKRWLPADGGALLFLQRRREAPVDGDAWVLASWRDGESPRALLRGSGSVWLMGAEGDTAVLQTKDQVLLVNVSRGGEPVKVPWVGRAFWSRTRGFYALRDERKPTARLERFDLASRTFTPVADVPGLELLETGEELVLRSGFEPQSATWVSPEGVLRPLGDWPFIQSVERKGQSLLVSWFEVRRQFGGVTRVLSEGP
ncbi:MAG: hypothetical protein GQE15_22010 [Archangiaceae bacterium]|nr:hypothetical protein [Archangiaceae bacterium]